MGSDWPAVGLGELYDFSSGLSKPRSAFGSGYPFLSFKDVFYNIVVPGELSERVNSSEKERERCSIHAGDVFLTRTSETQEELGMSSVALRSIPDATFNGFTKRLRPKAGTSIDPRYAAYYFRSPGFRRAVGSMSSLSTRASLNNEMLGRLEMVVPSPSEQEAIASVLGVLDDKIELSRKMSRTLDEMAQAIFKSWFVDFDGREINQESGRPDAWGEVPFSETVEILSGGTPKTSVEEYWSGNNPWFAIADAPGAGEVFVLDTAKKVTQAGIDNSAAQILPSGTTIVTARGTVGERAVAGVDMAINQSCFGLRGRHGASDYYTYAATGLVVDRLKQYSHGSVFSTINRSTFNSVSIVDPPPFVIHEYEEAIAPIMERIRLNGLQSATVSQLRDTLLPRLLSGELRVMDAEAIVEEAV